MAGELADGQSPMEQGDTSGEDVILDIVRNPNSFATHFEGEYAEVRKRLLGCVEGLENIYSGVGQADRMGVLHAIGELFNNQGSVAGSTIHWEFYRPFALEHDYTRKTEYLPGKWADAAIPVGELNKEQAAEWEKYLTSVPFIEQKRMLAAKAISLVGLPTVTVKYKPQNIPLALELEQAKRKVVMKLIPNISDEEAQAALGSRYTSDTVRSTPTPEFLLGFW